MRTGKNPAKAGLPAYVPKNLGIALIVYIPFSEGYFRYSLDILKYQLASIRASTSQEYDLLVFDNGSCDQVRIELHGLHKDKWIDWLILSQHNVGKAGAWNWIFAAMPNELICYADSDVLFRSGWLEASLEILAAFPKAGMVAAQPNFFDVMEGAGIAHQLMPASEIFEFGDYWPAQEIVDEYCFGIGASGELAAQFYERPLPSISNRELGIQAVIGASHMQFLTRREIARQIVPLKASKGLLRSETMGIDYKIDELGYLHLSTLEPHVFHMGNTLNDRLLAEINRVIGSAEASAPTKQIIQKRSRMHRILAKLAQQPRYNRYLLRLYDSLFRVLYSEN